MNNFIVCLNAVLPIFIALAIGYIARLSGIIRGEDVPKMNKVAFRVFMPAMVFYNIYNSDLSSSVNPKLIVYTVVTIFIIFVAALLVVNRTEPDFKRRGVVTQGIYRSNFVIIGLPIALSLIEGADMGAVAVLLAVVAPEFNILAVVVLSIYNGEKIDIKKTVKNILSNPLIIGSALGIVALLLKIKLPTPLEKVVKDYCNVASPLSLFLLGAFFQFNSLGSGLKELIWTCIGRLIISPAIGLTAGYLIGFRGIEFVALIGAFASSSAVSSFTMAQQMGGDAELAGNIVVVTSALCPLTVFVWSFIFKTLGAF